MMKILLLSSITFWLCKSAFGSYNISIFLSRFNNPGHKLKDGSRCEFGVAYRCDHYFQICLDFANGTREDVNQCRITDRFQAKLQKSEKENSIEQPWKGKVLMKVRVLDEDPIGTDELVDDLSDIIELNASRSRNNKDTFVKDLILHGTRTSLTVQVKVYCNDNWHGPNCDCHTHPKHTYTCNDDGSKNCKPDWHGHDCDVYCRTNELYHYNCSANGTKKCHEHYYGEDCEKYCEPQDDDKAHFTCAQNGSKICLKNWCSENCNMSCPESSTSGLALQTTPRFNNGISENNTYAERSDENNTTTSSMIPQESQVQTDERGKNDEKPYLTPIIGGVTGITLLVAVALGVLFWNRKHQKKSENSQNEMTLMQGPANSADNNNGGVIYDEINQSEHLYEDAETIPEQLYEDPNADNTADTYCVHEPDNISDSALIMDNECYGSASEVRQKKPQDVRAAVNASEDVLIMDNELYGSSSEEQMMKPDNECGSVLIMDNECYGSASEVRKTRPQNVGVVANVSDDVLIMDNELYGSLSEEQMMKLDNISDGVLIMDNECYGSASEVRQTKPQDVGAAVNASDDVLIVDNELYGSASEISLSRLPNVGATANASDDVLIMENELYGSAYEASQSKLQNFGATANASDDKLYDSALEEQKIKLEEAGAAANFYDDVLIMSNEIYGSASEVQETEPRKVIAARCTSDDVLILDNELYGSALEEQKIKPEEAGDITNVSDDVLIMDNELYGSASEVQQTELRKAIGSKDASDDVLIVDNELYGSAS